MQRFIKHFCLLLVLLYTHAASAMLSMELTRGVSGAIPIAIVPFQSHVNSLPQDVSNIVTTDLQNSGRFKVTGGDQISITAANAADVSSDYFRRLGTDNVVVGQIREAGDGRYQVSFELLNVFHGGNKPHVVLSKHFTANAGQLRSVAHRISDLIYEEITGVRGVFSTKIAYVVVHRYSPTQKRYILEVADQDGYAPKPLLNSPEPIMSPSWAPNGKKIAYVSFENRRAGIYVQDVSSGARQLVSQYSGINGAPAWSPDGRKLAVVLSKEGSPNIYLLDLGSRQLRALTHDFYINTEPAWAPNGRSLLFTSNRSGGPQIYKIDIGSGDVSRMSYDGDYNARASYTHDGQHIVMIHRVSGLFRIAALDLDSGHVRVLSGTTDDSASPSVAPNGSMILYDTIHGGRNVLGMVSADGRVQLILPLRQGDAQDPAWSPFL